MALFSITFDGAYEDTIETVLPILEAYGLKATFFVTSGYLGRSLDGHRVADEKRLKRVLSQGHEIGAHSVTHALLRQSAAQKVFDLINRAIRSGKFTESIRRVNVSKVRRTVGEEEAGRLMVEQYLKEAADSKKVLEDILGVEILSYAYPGGRYSNKVIKAMPELGYLSSRTTLQGTNSKESNPFALRSFVWRSETPLSEFERYVDFVRGKDWGISTFHGVGRKVGSYDVSEDIFKKNCEFLVEKIGKEGVVTQSQGLKAIGLS